MIYQKEIKIFNNISCLDGIKLIGIKQLNCGEYKITPSDLSTFIKAYGKDENNFYDMMKNYLWIHGNERGSKNK